MPERKDKDKVVLLTEPQSCKLAKLLLSEMHAVIYEYAAVTGGRSAVTYMSHTAVK